MSATKIEWTDATWNPLHGCTRTSPGCDHCYAATMARRLAGRHGYPTGDGFAVTLRPERLAEPLRWQTPRRVFVCSMGDLFHPSVPDRFIAAVFGVMAACPDHVFQVLTKRAARMEEWFSKWAARAAQESCSLADGCICEAERQVYAAGGRKTLAFWTAAQIAHHDNRAGLETWPLPNVWLGVTAEDQQRADERIPHLLATPAAVRFVSVEPMLGPVDLNAETVGEVCALDSGGVDWVICGGESGHGARPMHPDWVRALRDQCADGFSVPFFFKQWGAHRPGPEVYTLRDPKRAGTVALWTTVSSTDRRSIGKSHWNAYDSDGRPFRMERVGKKAAGHLLDGEVVREYPARGGEGAA